MKKIAFLFVLLLAFYSCESDSKNELEFVQMTALNASNVTNNGFRANWDKISICEKYEIELSINDNFSNILETHQITDNELNYYEFSNLEENQFYHYRVRYYIGEEYSEYSNFIRIQTNRVKTNFQITTNDNLKLFGEIYKKAIYLKPAPLVLFLHEGMSNRSEWTNHMLYKMCVDSGYVSAAIDLRAHGESDGVLNWITFQSDPNILPADLLVILDYLKTQDYIDATRIAIIGGSLGAIIGTGASTYSEIKTVVALTSFYDPVIALYGSTGINTVFYIAGQFDNAAESENLYNITNEPKKIEIISGSSAHGVSLITTDELRDDIFNWVKNYL